MAARFDDCKRLQITSNPMLPFNTRIKSGPTVLRQSRDVTRIDGVVCGMTSRRLAVKVLKSFVPVLLCVVSVFLTSRASQTSALGSPVSADIASSIRGGACTGYNNTDEC